MLGAIPRYSALGDWRTREDDDYGVMLLEMWAYMADVLSFYDEVIAHEVYLRTARLKPSLRKLVNLLGYVPKPAVASKTKLAVLADGRKTISLPKGMAFRSGAFDGEKPQVFELDKKTKIHPLNSKWELTSPPQTNLGTSTTGTGSFGSLTLKVDNPLKKNDIVLVHLSPANTNFQVSLISSIEDGETDDGGKAKDVKFSPVLSLPNNTSPKAVTLLKPSLTDGLWTGTSYSGDPAAISGSTIVLDGLYRQIKGGQHIILGKDGKYRWYKVAENKEVMMKISAAGTETATDKDGNSVTISIPSLKVAATKLKLDASVNASGRKMSGDSQTWTSSDTPKMVLHYAFSSGGEVVLGKKTTLTASDSLVIKGKVEKPITGEEPSSLFLEDKNEIGIEVDGSVDYDDGEVDLGQGVSWSQTITNPVTVFGNVISTSRGETVSNEVLGSGDGTLVDQRFKLKKKPLTYLSAPTAANEQGVLSTLKVYVDNILWKEVPSFFKAGANDHVYIVRQDDDGESHVTFGDGLRGARLPSGKGNVVATYRYGAGKAAPPAGGITQMVKPVKGVTAVKNPVAASGGDDAESSKNLRENAPKSTLLLGRAVSILDMGAAAVGVPGVRAAEVSWQWSQTRQGAMVHVWYIGSETIKKDIVAKLQKLSDTTTLIAAGRAAPIPATMTLDVKVDSTYVTSVVLADVRTALLESEVGMLVPEKLGIGKPLFRSQVFAAVLAVEGVEAVQGVQLSYPGIQGTWDSFGIKPDTGKYFDFEQGGLVLNGSGA
jgi:hypothetical protein